MTNKKFDKLFGGPPRKAETEITQKEMDLARSIQAATEEIVLRIIRYAHKISGKKNLCLAGGVALNCVANGRILKEGPFERIWIQPAAGDAGGAIGAALRIWHRYLGKTRDIADGKDRQKGSFLGPVYTDSYIENYFNENNIPYQKFSIGELIKRTASIIADGNIVGWFQGRMEFGPRALGARSIIGDPRRPEMQCRMNLKIKFRESFRPFAPSVLSEKTKDFFDISCDSPYMLLVADVKDGFPYVKPSKEPIGFERLKIVRSRIPAVTHVDNSARIQTVSRDTDNTAYYDLLNEFYKLTGCPVIINTSFNVRGEPIVCDPEDAYRCFMRTDMDYLVMGSFILDKRNQPERKLKREQYFELD